MVVVTSSMPCAPTEEPSDHAAAVELLWIPLGAGAVVVRASGRLFEAVSAFVHRRQSNDLYHSALVVTVPTGRVVIEMTPVPDKYPGHRGVVSEGSVGVRWAGRLRVFRYEIRRWTGGVIPDEHEAAARVRIAVELSRAQRLLDLVPSVPNPVWGRDEFGTGDMWNSNSVVSWLLSRAGFDMASIDPPAGGRAPGWDAGLKVAARDLTSRSLADASPIGPRRADIGPLERWR
jgi:hypothetical protein